MRIGLILISIFFSFLFQVRGQIIFERIYGGLYDDSGNSAKQTSDSGYIFTGGTFSSGAGKEDVILIKTDSLGDTLWTKTYGGPENDHGNSVFSTFEGGYLIAGSTSSFGSGLNDFFLIRTNNFGDTLWTKTFGGEYEDVGNWAQPTGDGGFIFCGNAVRTGAGDFDVVVIKTNEYGDTLWTKVFGGTGNDYGYSIHPTTDGKFILTGYSDNFGGGSGVYLYKMEEGGDSVWAKTYGGVNSFEINSAIQTNDGGFIIGCSTYSDVKSNEFLLIKTDDIGDTLWTKSYGGNNADFGCSVIQTKDDGYAIVGWTYSFGGGLEDVYLIKTNEIGIPVWTKTFGGTGFERGISLEQTFDGGFIICGSAVNFSSGGSALFLVKTDPGGNGYPAGNPNLNFAGSPTLSVIPNPFSKSARVVNNGWGELNNSIRLYNVLGEEINFTGDVKPVESSFGKTDIEIFRQNLNPGIYLLESGNQFARIIITD